MDGAGALWAADAQLAANFNRHAFELAELARALSDYVQRRRRFGPAGPAGGEAKGFDVTEALGSGGLPWVSNVPHHPNPH